MDLQIFTLDEEAGEIEVTLTKKEVLHFADKPKKEKEMYIMRKFINEFILFNGGSQSECFRQINEFRVSHGYPAWKNQFTIDAIWDNLIGDNLIKDSEKKRSGGKARAMIAIFPDGTTIEAPTRTELEKILNEKFELKPNYIGDLAKSGKPFVPRLYKHTKLKGVIVRYLDEL